MQIELFWPIAMIILGLVLFRLCFEKLKTWRVHKRLAKSGIRDIDRMDGYQFEVYLRVLFKEKGYKPIVTKKSGDFGADLILSGEKKIVVQAKRYGIKNRVSIGAVQEVFAAKSFYIADEAWVVTNSHYTKSAKTLAKACGVILLDRYTLQEFINDINLEVTPKQIYQEVAPEERKCVACGNMLVVRNTTHGSRFMGCNSFPTCNHTEAINYIK